MEFYGMTGEKLGTIGQAEGGVAKMADLPGWKKAFLEKPSISVRKGIAWGFSPPYEDTSTLVLTSPSGVFVDIRFPLQTTPSRPLAADPSFWAFSGTSSTTFPPETSGVSMPYSAHAVWTHEIDSKGQGISDEGDMFLLPNDDCIEVGMMENPQTKQVELYKEYWSTPFVEPGSGGDLRRSPCVVARTSGLGVHGATRNGGGVVIRVGDYCQGILQQCDHRGAPRDVLVERWQKLPIQRNPALSSEVPDTGNHNDPTDWLKDWHSNTREDETSMPCLWICVENRKLGDEIVLHGVTWSVVESVDT